MVMIGLLIWIACMRRELTQLVSLSGFCLYSYKVLVDNPTRCCVITKYIIYM
jgi:hypothetical protein